MEAQESIDLSDVKQPYKHVNEKENNTPSELRNYRYVKKSTLYWIVCLTVVVAAILLVIYGIVVYYIASVVPEGYVLPPKDELQLSDQPVDDMQVSDQTTASEMTMSHEVTGTSTNKSSTDRPVTTSHDVMTTATAKSSTDRPVTTSHDVMTTATAKSPPECRYGWILTHRLSCYYISGDAQDWNTASRKCLVMGGYIVAINDADENEYLVTVVKRLNGDNYWIGLTDKINEGSWVWRNNSTALNTGHYSNWNPGQPDNGGGSEHCAALIEEYSYSWNDDQCDSSYRYICEQDWQ